MMTKVGDLFKLTQHSDVTDSIMRKVEQHYGLGHREILDYDKKPTISQARMIIHYLAYVKTGHSYSELADVFHRDVSSVRHNVVKVRHDDRLERLAESIWES